MRLLNSKHVTQEENESTLTFDHFNHTFSVYTTAYRPAQVIARRFPEYCKFADDGASITANDIPMHLITKLTLSSFRDYHLPATT